MVRSKREKVFISYSHKDASWMERLRVHLEPLERTGLLDFWFDEDIEPGDDWFAAIEKAIDETRVAVLLISPDFLASEFIAEHELPRILKAAERGTLRVLPLYIAASNVGVMQDLSGFQGINDPQQPLASLGEADQDVALVKASRAIINALDIAPWKQKKFLLQRMLPLVGILVIFAAAAFFFLSPIIQERTTRAVVLIPGLDVRNVLPQTNGSVTRARKLTVDLPGATVSVDTMFQRIYVIGGEPAVLERLFRQHEEIWRSAVRTYLINSGGVVAGNLDLAVDRVISLDPVFIASTKLRSGDAIQVSILEDTRSETRTRLNETLTIQESPVTAQVLVFSE